MNKFFHRNSSSRFRPSLEGLETRTVPAFVNGFILGIGELSVGANDTVIVTEDHTLDKIEVSHSVNGGPPLVQTFNTSGVWTIAVDLAKGNDSFQYRVAGGSDFTDRKYMRVQLGNGVNQARFDVQADTAGGAIDILADLSIRVDGGNQRDVVGAGFGRIDDEEVTFRTELLGGKDEVTAVLADDLDNQAEVVFDFRDVLDTPVYRGGDDVMVVLAMNDVDIDAAATLDVSMSGSSGSDRMRLMYDGELDGKLTTRMNGGDAQDEVRGFITLDPGSQGELDAIVRGNAHPADLVQLVLMDNSGGLATITNALAMQN